MRYLLFYVAALAAHCVAAGVGEPPVEAARLVNNVRRGDIIRPKVETHRIYEPMEGWSYAHGVRLAKFRGRFFAMFANCQKDEGQCGSRVVLSTSDDATTWSEPSVLMAPRSGEASDLALFAGGFICDGSRLHAYVFGGEYPAEGLRGPNVRPLKDGFAYRLSWMLTTEDGVTWSEPRQTPFWVIRPCRTPSGKWIGMGPPYYPWTTEPGEPASWRKAPIDMKRLSLFSPLPKLVTESHLAPGESGGALRMFHRTELGNIWMSESRDDAKTWSAPAPTSFRHDNSMFAFGSMPDGRVFAVGNPVGDHKRIPLVLMLSDNGVDFPHWFMIRDEPVKRRFDGLYKGGTYGYPEVLVDGGSVYVAYSVNKEAIDISRIALSEFGCGGAADAKPVGGEFVAPPVAGHVHASTILQLRTKGDYAVAWFEGSKEGEGDVAIRMSRRIGGAWEPVRTVAKVNPSSPHWNPVLRRCDDGRIELYFKVGRNCADWRTYVQESRDDALSWSNPRELVPGDVSGGRGPVKNKCLKLSDGRWLAPASREFDPAAKWELRQLWRSFVDISDDDGKSWRSSPAFPVPADVAPDGRAASGRKMPFGVIQPTLWEDPSGIHALLRATDGWIWRSDSVDRGETWSECRRTSLRNVNSGIDCALGSDGRLYLAMNGYGGEKGWGARNHLEIKVSEDGGETWRTYAVLAHDGPKQKDGRATEFSYPAIIDAGEGVIAVSFTWNRRQIRVCEIDTRRR